MSVGGDVALGIDHDAGAKAAGGVDLDDRGQHCRDQGVVLRLQLGQAAGGGRGGAAGAGGGGGVGGCVAGRRGGGGLGRLLDLGGRGQPYR